LVYNIINTFQQLEFARNESELFVAGAISQSTEIEKLLNPYFENISLINTIDLIGNPEVL
jgi:hypothetical protein